MENKWVIVSVFLCLLCISSGQTKDVTQPPDHEHRFHPAAGKVDDSGRFVPSNPPPALEVMPADPDAWLEEAKGLVVPQGDGIFTLGEIRCDRRTRTISVPAEVNMTDGQLEYLLVTKQGKIHESLFVTGASPVHVHLAALLLGFGGVAPDGKQVQVDLQVSWETNGPARLYPAGELVALAEESPAGPAGGTLAAGVWQYGGSTLDSNGFGAARDGSIVALITDPAALVLNPRQSSARDDLHIPNSKLIPPKGFPVMIHIRPVSTPASTPPDSPEP